MLIEKTARSTLTAFELDPGDELRFTMRDGSTRLIKLIKTWANIHETNLKEPKKGHPRGHTVCRMHCTLEIDGTTLQLVRWVGNDRSFYQPWEIFGLRLWFDACRPLFEHLTENHGTTRPGPGKEARFAIQDAALRICPVLLHPWCPLPADGLRIEHCYDNCDCWLGPYFGADSHGGLDINHPAGTTLYAPLSFDQHGFFDSLSAGANNNRWRGVHQWDDGSTWILQAHHIIALLVPENNFLAAGTPYALSAGVLTGSHEHSHFVFIVKDNGEEYMLDPWILFWQMYRDRSITTA